MKIAPTASGRINRDRVSSYYLSSDTAIRDAPPLIADQSDALSDISEYSGSDIEQIEGESPAPYWVIRVLDVQVPVNAWTAIVDSQVGRYGGTTDLSLKTIPSTHSTWRFWKINRGEGTAISHQAVFGPGMSRSMGPRCIEFCRSHGILTELGRCLDKVTEIFSNVVSVSVDYDRFPADESDEEGHVVIAVELRSGQDTAFRDYERYVDWMLESIPPAKAVFFVTTFNRI